MRRLSSFSRQTFGVRNRGPWRSIISHSLHQFHENDLFTSAAAMSYFGLMALSVLVTSLVVGVREMAGRISPRQAAHYPLLLSVGSVFWQGVFAIASFLITVTLFVVVYRFMPKAEVILRDTLPGAIIGGVLWEVAKYVFAWALNYFHYDQIYGSVGAVVAVLTWSYVSSLILLFGAQLTAVFHREHPT